jgi:putative FmdB family regulatory protein
MPPIFEYECEREHRSTIHVSLLGRPNEIKCPVCGKTAQRIISMQQRPIVKGGTPRFHHEPGKGK